ncbi:ISLre2 family transposase [Streptococcus equi]|uniref:ISLre2 family transposase n=1 Tax=Streptococcus equi TaxID=1336 RepID=UPI0010C269F0|nr:DDE transposase [Streptococcus equi subsp. zooepidemicus]
MKFNERAFIEERDRQIKLTFLKEVANYDKQVAPIMRAKGYCRIDATERTVLFTFGEITYLRNRWRRKKETCYPVDEWLGLKKYMRYSPELIFHMVKHASKLPYREVCRIMQDAYPIDVSKDAVLKAVKLAGKLFSEKESYRFYLEEEVSEKIKAPKIYVEGDGVWIKTRSKKNSQCYTDLTHFLVHTGSLKDNHSRPTLANKHEIIHTNHEKAKEELLDYLYNHFEITDQTILITNSDGGIGYGRRTFQEIQKALGIKRHEHFWDESHLHKEINTFFAPYSKPLRDLAYKAIETHQRSLLVVVLDTVESLIEREDEKEKCEHFRQKILRNFKDTKPAKLRGLSHQCIGVMESQHRKITYRMKRRGMYWSLEGVCAMAKTILLERIDQLEDLFFGNWRQQYALYQGNSFSAGYSNRRVEESPPIRTYKSGHKTGRWRSRTK